MDSFRYRHDSPPATSSRAVKTTRPIAGWAPEPPFTESADLRASALATDISLYQLILGRRDLAECGVDEPVTHCGLGARGGEVCAAGGSSPMRRQTFQAIDARPHRGRPAVRRGCPTHSNVCRP
jgi:hypothetical protein